MSFTAITVTETFLPDAPGGPLPSGEVVFTLDERIHDGSGNELEPQAIAAVLSGAVTLEANGASAGTFTLGWNGLNTAAIAYNASAATVLAALNLLAGFAALNATASGGPANSAPVVITIPGSPQTITANWSGLTGGTNTIASASTMSVVLDANDDSTTVPAGSNYSVEFFLQGVSQRPPISVVVPHAAPGATCTLASLS